MKTLWLGSSNQKLCDNADVLLCVRLCRREGCGTLQSGLKHTFAKASWSSSFSDCSGQVTLDA